MVGLLILTPSWSDDVGENIDLIMARPDYKDFTIGLWGQVTDKTFIKK